MRRYVPLIPHDSESQLKENVQIVKSSGAPPLVVERSMSSPDLVQREPVHGPPRIDTDTEPPSSVIQAGPTARGGAEHPAPGRTKTGKLKLAVRRLADFNVKGRKEL